MTSPSRPQAIVPWRFTSVNKATTSHCTMLRRLLTCLALLTGLAAVAAPAQAENVRSLVSQVEAATGDPAECKSDERTCECREKARDGRKAEDKACPREKRRTIYIPPIYISADLALE